MKGIISIFLPANQRKYLYTFGSVLMFLFFILTMGDTSGQYPPEFSYTFLALAIFTGILAVYGFTKKK